MTSCQSRMDCVSCHCNWCHCVCCRASKVWWEGRKHVPSSVTRNMEATSLSVPHETIVRRTPLVQKNPCLYSTHTLEPSVCQFCCHWMPGPSPLPFSMIFSAAWDSTLSTLQSWAIFFPWESVHEKLKCIQPTSFFFPSKWKRKNVYSYTQMTYLNDRKHWKRSTLLLNISNTDIWVYLRSSNLESVFLISFLQLDCRPLLEAGARSGGGSSRGASWVRGNI